MSEHGEAGKSIRLGILSAGDPDDVRTWSGVPHFMTQALRKHFENVTYLPVFNSAAHERQRKLDRLLRRFTGRGFLPGRTFGQSRRYAARIDRRLKKTPVDALVALTVDEQIACLAPGVPIIHHSDATFAVMEDYYPEFSNLWPGARRTAHELTRRGLANATVCTYPSRHAASSAADDYQCDRRKIQVVPYGANLQDAPDGGSATDISRRQHCQLLFIGVDWVRKGGDIAFATLLELLERGVDASLVMVGCQAPAHVRHEKLRLIPFLNKQIPQQREQYESLWRTSAFFLLPSRQETFGAVFCEAAAYGMPVIAAATGGVADAVDDGRSGRLLPPEAGAGEYAGVIESIWLDRPTYQQMVHGARSRFEHVLNWDVWGNTMARIIKHAVAPG